MVLNLSRNVVKHIPQPYYLNSNGYLFYTVFLLLLRKTDGDVRLAYLKKHVYFET